MNQPSRPTGQGTEAPLVSVIVPVYNAKRYLKDCVRSLQAQTEKNIEILLVDDGSTDGSGVICDQFAAQDDRIVVCHQKNGGVSAARNKGLELASGKYIMFCDSDDTVLPRYCQAHLEAMALPGVFLTISATRPVPAEISRNRDEGEKYFPEYRHLLQLWAAGWLWCCWGKCYDSQVIRRCGLRFREQVAHGEDSIFVVEYMTCLLDQPGRICLWQEHLYCYYNTPGSLSKITSAMEESIGYKMEAIGRMDALVGFAPREMEDLLAADRIGMMDLALQDSLRRYKAWQLRQGCRAAKEALARPEMQQAIEDASRLNVFGHRYREILRTGSPLLLHLFLHLRWFLWEGLPARLFSRRLVKS